jgi:hypothetical protein
MPGVVRGLAGARLPKQVKRRVASTSDILTRPVRRRMRSPYRDGVDASLVHVAHHRVGTVWFGKVLSLIARHFVLSFKRIVPESDVPNAEVLLYRHARLFDRTRLGPFRGSHLIRDPRDIVVSGYHYHLWTDEKWVHIPRPEYGGLTYQEYLRSLDREAGLATEISRTARLDFGDMGAWDYTQPEFLELKYEDFIDDEASHFARMFRHYGFNEAAVERSVDLALTCSFQRTTGRSIGQVQEGSHRRSGKPGQWREVFTPAHKALFRELNGDLLERLGYDSGDDW